MIVSNFDKEKVKEERLLIETDAQYFYPTGYRQSTPYLITVAEIIGQKRGMIHEEMLELTVRKEQRLYSVRRAIMEGSQKLVWRLMGTYH